MGNLGYYNGEIKNLEDLKIPATDRAVYFGDGVYDVAHAVNRKIFALDEHLDRFYSGCKSLEINFKLQKNELKTLIEDLAKKQGSESQKIFWQVSRGTAIRNHIFPKDSTSNLLIMITESFLTDFENVCYDLISVEDTRFFHCNIKTLNLIPAVMASEKAKRANCQEAVLFRDDKVTECAHSNISILKEGVFRTAPLNNLILPGVTRSHLIKIAKNLKVPVIEKAFTLAELFECDEAIVSSCSAPCVRVKSIDAKKVGGKDGSLLKKFQASYRELITKECGNF